MHIAFACLLLGTAPAVTSDVHDTSLSGRYVEARTASVFAGPCHFNGEYTTQGREAVLALSFDSGTLHGVALDGLSIAAAVSADANLAELGKRSSVVYLPHEVSDAQRGALLAALRERSGVDLGDVREVRSASVDVVADEDGFRVRVDGEQGSVLELTGRAMPDRACCTMPQGVWYQPLVPLDSRLVGFCERLQLSERALGQQLSRAGENSAFVGHFRF